MATQIKSISSTPANIVSDLSLSSGSTYLIQASGSTYLIQAIGSSSVYLAEAASAPSATDGTHIIPPTGTWKLTVGTGGIWVWTVGGGSRIAVTES